MYTNSLSAALVHKHLHAHMCADTQTQYGTVYVLRASDGTMINRICGASAYSGQKRPESQLNRFQV